jgi:A1 cistron-splicing factor AAR2
MLFGEMQFAFLCFLLAENFEGFEQWKNMFILVTSCEDYVKENPGFFMDLIRKEFASAINKESIFL